MRIELTNYSVDIIHMLFSFLNIFYKEKDLVLNILKSIKHYLDIEEDENGYLDFSPRNKLISFGFEHIIAEIIGSYTYDKVVIISEQIEEMLQTMRENDMQV